MAADPSDSSSTVAATGDSLLAPAADAPDAVLPVAAPDLDTEFGFQRPELGKEKLAGTVGFHERHVFLCFKGPEEWPSHVEATQSDSLPGLLAAALKARKPNLKKSTKLTIFEGDGTESTLGDVLIFPDMIRYRGLIHSNVDNFVEEVLVKDIEWGPGSPEAIIGSYVFVCCHGSRDKGCGVWGPALIKRFKEEIKGQGLDGQVAVSACSHVGGHKYAGNVIIFSSDAKGEVTGHWYGYVAPDDVPVLLDKHIGQGENADHIWRPMDLHWLEFEELLDLEGKRGRGQGKHGRGKGKRGRGKGKRGRGKGKRGRGKGMGRDAPMELPDFLFNMPALPVLVPALTRRKLKNRKYRKNAAARLEAWRLLQKDFAGSVRGGKSDACK